MWGHRATTEQQQPGVAPDSSRSGKTPEAAPGGLRGYRLRQASTSVILGTQQQQGFSLSPKPWTWLLWPWLPRPSSWRASPTPTAALRRSGQQAARCSLDIDIQRQYQLVTTRMDPLPNNTRSHTGHNNHKNASPSAFISVDAQLDFV